jgi:hypothetical protein
MTSACNFNWRGRPAGARRRGTTQGGWHALRSAEYYVGYPEWIGHEPFPEYPEAELWLEA